MLRLCLLSWPNVTKVDEKSNGRRQDAVVELPISKGYARVLMERGRLFDDERGGANGGLLGELVLSKERDLMSWLESAAGAVTH